MKRPKPPEKPEKPKQRAPMRPAVPAAEQEIPLDADRWSAFRDSFGEREVGIDADGTPIELLRLIKEFTPVENALAERITKLAKADRPGVGRPLRLEQDDQKRRPRLVVVSERVAGVRLTDAMTRGASRSVVPDIGAAMYVMRRLFSIASTLQKTSGLSHFVIAPERVVITPRAEVVVVEAALAAGTEALAASESFPKAVKLALSEVNSKKHGLRLDIARIARIGVAMLIGRGIDASETVDALSPVLNEVGEVSAIRAGDAFAASMRAWLEQALTIEAGVSFADFQAAGDALVATRPPKDCAASRATLRSYLENLEIDDLGEADTLALELDRVQSIRARQTAGRRGATRGWLSPVARELGLPHKDEVLQESPSEIAAKPLSRPPASEDADAGEIDMTTALEEMAEAGPAASRRADEPAVFDLGPASPTPAPAKAWSPPPAPAAGEPVKDSVLKAVASRFGFLLKDEPANKPAAGAPPPPAMQAPPAPVDVPPAPVLQAPPLVIEYTSMAEPPVVLQAAPATDTPSAWQAPPPPATLPPLAVEPEAVQHAESLADSASTAEPLEGAEAVSKRPKKSWFRSVAKQFGMKEGGKPGEPGVTEPAANLDAALAAQEEARRHADAEVQRVAGAEAEARRQAAQAEAQRVVEEARRMAAEAEARRAAEEARRLAAEAEARRIAEDTRRLAAEADARRVEQEARRAAEAEARRRAEEAEARRVAAEAEARRATEAEARRLAAEAEARRVAEAEARRLAAEAEARRAAEAEARRIAEARRLAAEAEARRAAEVQARRLAEEAEGRKKAEAEARKKAEAEARRLAAQAQARRAAEEAEATRAAEEAEKRAAAEAGEGVEEEVEEEPAEADSREEWVKSMAAEMGLKSEDTPSQTPMPTATWQAATPALGTPRPTDVKAPPPSPPPPPPNPPASPYQGQPQSVGPSAGWQAPTPAYGTPSPSAYGAPTPPSPYGAPTPSSPYGAPAPSPYGAPAPSPYGAPTQSPYGAPTQSPYGAPAPSPYGAPTQSAYGAPTPSAYGSPTPSGYGSPTSGPPAHAPAWQPPVAEHPSAHVADVWPDTQSASRAESVSAASQLMRSAALLIIAAGVVIALGWFGYSYYAQNVQPGTVAIESNPPGAEIFVDGASKGVTPTTIELSPGKHALELRRRGVVRQISLDITAGEQLKQQIDLTNLRPVGTLVVNSTPTGAKVLVDGRERGVTPVTLSDLTVGGHKVQLQSTAGSVTKDVQIQAGATVNLDEGIFSGWIAVFAPFDVQVFERKRLIGTTDNERIMLPPGHHELEFVNAQRGFRETRVVELGSGATVPVNIEKTVGTLRIDAPAGAEIFIDGAKVGEAPLAEQTVTVGTREILVKHPDLGEKKVTATVTSTATAVVKVEFTP